MFIKEYLIAVSLLIAGGCAPAYNCYECGCTPYEYCRRPALPYVTYESCCETPVAKSYSWTPQPNPQLIEPDTLSVEPAEAPTPID